MRFSAGCHHRGFAPTLLFGHCVAAVNTACAKRRVPLVEAVRMLRRRHYRGGRKQEAVAGHTSGSTRCRGQLGRGCGAEPEPSRCKVRTNFSSSAGRTTCSTWQHQQCAKPEAARGIARQCPSAALQVNCRAYCTTELSTATPGGAHPPCTASCGPARRIPGSCRRSRC